MLHEILVRFRGRLDALKEGRVGEVSLRDRALAFFVRDQALPRLEVVARIDRELDAIGVHTAEDARLLRDLGVQQGRAGAVATGLAARAEEAIAEFDDRLRRLERAQLAGAPIPGGLTQLEQSFLRLARAVKVADLFSERPSDAQDPEFELFPRVSPLPAGVPARAVVAVAQLWTERARGNVHDLVQKRRDLDAAHELLLRAGSELDRDRVRLLRMEVSQARERVREVPPARSLDAVLRQVRLNARRDPGAAYQSLRGVHERAVEAGNRELAEATWRALAPVVRGSPGARELLESNDLEVVGRFSTAAPGTSITGTAPAGGAGADGRLAKLAFSLDDERMAAFELAAGCARYFDVEDALAEEVVEADAQLRRPAPRRVPYPTQTMTFEPTGGLHEHENFVLTDPRMLVYDLASGRQLVRVYLDDAPDVRSKRVRRTSVRVYVCDASGSMHGPRARFRDAILIAELNNLRLKAERGLPFDPLYFSFFNDQPTELARVDNALEAARQMEKLFRDSPAEGQTDITIALMSAFDSIRAARGHDPYLARATVVLVTDGEDRMELELIRRCRAPLDDVQIALSFISLGEENPDLRSLVMEQRSQGGRAFYHHLSDREIGLARTEFDARFRTLLPAHLPVTTAALEQLLPQLEALEKLAAALPPPKRTGGSGFDAMFPEPSESGSRPRSGHDGPPPQATAEELARLADILAAIAEAGALAPAEHRGEESVALLQHLLGMYGIPVGRYLAVAAAPPATVRQPLERVRLVCRPFG